MKLNKFALPLVLALVAAVAVTGCKKGFNGKVTNIPGHNTPIVGSQPTDISTLPPATPFDPNASSQPKSDSLPTGPIKYSDSRPFNLSDYDQDRAALAEQTVHFAFDSSAILSKEENKLVIVAEKLKSDPSAKLLIEGHCDERGTDEYNRALGERRAMALREALIRAGIDQDAIQTISFGKDKPADPAHDEAAWAKNRRGEFVLLHKKAGV